MSALDKLSLALGAANLETNIALARLNFDFSLYKVGAPKEYEELGAMLTKHRRQVAEGGTSHITARKLAAFFEELLPPVPYLISAYGKRASDIAKSSALDPERRAQYGVFAENAGIDGTNIWAAATSGNAAIERESKHPKVSRTLPR